MAVVSRRCTKRMYETLLTTCNRIFIIEGALTVVMAFAGYALLPNYPSNTSFLSAEETAMAQWRLDRENDGVADEVKESVFVGLKQAFSDPKVVSTLHYLYYYLTLTWSVATTRVHPDLCSCLYELYLFLPIDRQDARLSPRRDTPAYCATILSSILILHSQLMALRTIW